MKGLLACFAIVCLAVASAAPTEEESKVVTKSFNFDKKDVIYARQPFSKDELVYAVCEGSSADKKCKVYVESADQDSVQSCDVSLTYGGRFDIDVVLSNAGNSKAVFAVRDGESKIKLISVNLKGCQVKEASVDVPHQITKQATPPLQVAIVAHEKNYDVVYQNKDLCHDFLCKATFDYEGKVVKAPNGFLVQDLEYASYQIESIKNAYLVSQTNPQSTNVYLVHEDDTKPHTLFSGARGVAGVSAQENTVGFCGYVDQKLTCKQFDAEGKNKKVEVEMTTGKGQADSLDVLNLEKGLLTLSVGIDNDTKERVVYVVHFDEQGKQSKFVKVDLKCDKQKVVLPKLYKNSNGEYCASSICVAPLDSSENHAAFSRNTRCFRKAELF